MNDNRVIAIATLGLLLLSMGTLYQTIVAGQVRLESRLTRVETLISTQAGSLQQQVNNHETRIERLEERSR